MFFLVIAVTLFLLTIPVILLLPEITPLSRLQVAIAHGVAIMLTLAMSALAAVPAKHYGVITTFGKVSERVLPAGLHLIAPWQKVVDIDGTIQTDEYSGDACIYVRIGDGSRACVTTTIRWRINGDKADVIYSDYRSNDPTESLRRAVVSTQFKSAMQEVLGDYNPVDALKESQSKNGDIKEAELSPDYEQVTKDLVVEMNKRLGGEPLVDIQDITISYFNLSQATQNKINSFMAAVADTRIASQRKATASEEAQANEILADSISNDPNVLVSKCLDIVDEAVAKKTTALPAGFTCWNESGNAVVVPASRH